MGFDTEKLFQFEKEGLLQEIDIHDVIDILMTTLSFRDSYTFEHSWRVAELATMIAQQMGLTVRSIERIHQAAHLHDIGKISVSDGLLNKSGKLTKEEEEKIQRHPVIGYKILQQVSLFKSISTIVLYHHERYDGLGYPGKLKSTDIPLGSRIIAVADTFDAITSNRSYRQAKSYHYAYNQINDHVNEQFCPVVVNSFNNIFEFIPEHLKKVEREIEGNFISKYGVQIDNDLLNSRKVQS